MSYSVIWTASVQWDIVDLWVGARDSMCIDEALRRIEERLAVDPLEFGESRDGSARIGFDDPLWCLFTVDEDAREVHVRAVWRV